MIGYSQTALEIVQRRERAWKKKYTVRDLLSGLDDPSMQVSSPSVVNQNNAYASVLIHHFQLRRVSNMTSGGRRRTQRALVVVGNKNGVAGTVHTVRGPHASWAAIQIMTPVCCRVLSSPSWSSGETTLTYLNVKIVCINLLIHLYPVHTN